MQDICIIGGGASGLAAAITAGREAQNNSILIIEKKDSVGRKLAATGNGKCNLTNIGCSGAPETLMFFDTLGIYTRVDEEGRVYPYSLQAKDVVYALAKGAEAVGAKMETGCTVLGVSKTDKGFSVETDKGTIKAKQLLIATGGKAAPQYGTTGDGYAIAKSLGHKVTRLAPVLTGIEVSEDISDLKGMRTKALVKLLKDGNEIEREFGEVQFGEDGISGICVMNLSRFIKLEDGEGFKEGIKRYSLELDFVPEMDMIQLHMMLDRRVKSGLVEDVLLSIVPKQLRNMMMDEMRLETIDIRAFARMLKGWRLSVSGTRGWKQAQCTAGGVSTDEIDMETMMSQICEELYFAGEVIDYDGPCGGYNLQNAWETGFKAGRAMAAAYNK